VNQNVVLLCILKRGDQANPVASEYIEALNAVREACGAYSFSCGVWHLGVKFDQLIVDIDENLREFIFLLEVSVRCARPFAEKPFLLIYLGFAFQKICSLAPNAKRTYDEGVQILSKGPGFAPGFFVL